ncbi:hypothetical protein H4S07_001047 [Coemansia furcata]|uniref:Uncharacterized protein n=1 Tax=Coemansia furcata TaxID=417177 RepID=A0ACC1LPE2_9FUNG|nr:hypothetical protein H4S07_001047 [Coemansia furcata]
MTGAIPEVSQVPGVQKDEAKMNTYNFKVAMSCSGCSGAVTKALEKYKDGLIKVIEATPVENTVVVRSTLPREEVLAVIRQTHKKVIGEPDVKAQAGEAIAKNLGESAKQAPGPSPAA